MSGRAGATDSVLSTECVILGCELLEVASSKTETVVGLFVCGWGDALLALALALIAMAVDGERIEVCCSSV